MIKYQIKKMIMYRRVVKKQKKTKKKQKQKQNLNFYTDVLNRIKPI